MGKQYLDTGWFEILVVLVLVVCILYNIARARRGKDLFIRRIPGLSSVDEAVGRATELGKPVIMVPGLSDPINAKAMQAINIFAHVSRIAAKFANPILFCCGSASVFTVAQEVIRDVYQQEGLIDRYDVDSVRFISDRQFAFASGVAGLIVREQAAACFLMGEFYAESLIFAETANSVGAMQIASSTETSQIPFFIAACDYVLIGDEFYAASAYLTRQPVLVGSLIGQDWCKMVVLALAIAGVLFNSVAMETQTDQTWESGKLVPGKTRNMTAGDTLFGRLLNPDPDLSQKIQRDKHPKDELPTGGSDAGGG